MAGPLGVSSGSGPEAGACPARAGLSGSTWPTFHSPHFILALLWQAPGSQSVSHQVKVTTLVSFIGGNQTFPEELEFRRGKALGLRFLFWDNSADSPDCTVKFCLYI